MTAAEALRDGVARLRGAGIADAARDGRLILSHAMGIGPDRLTLHAGDRLDGAALARFDAAIARRLARQPVSQIVGKRQFWGRDFIVTPDTLDPRPETECLIAEALSEPFSRILDLGTGTGCIVLTLLAERGTATGLAVDLSEPALGVARRNAAALEVAPRAELLHGDWFAGVAGTFDLIVSNPPYIAAAEMADLAPEVRDWEPHLALTPGGDGLAAYRILAAQSGRHLARGGRVIAEIGATQGPAVRDIFAAQGFADLRICQDMDGRDRAIVARN